MKTRDNDTRRMEELLGKYRFTRPVPPGVRGEIMASKKRVFVRVMKSVGAFGVLHGAFLSLYFALKKGGAWALIAKIAAGCVAAAALSFGGYYAVSAVVDRLAAGRSAVNAQPERGAGWEDEIILFDGRIIRGAIVSRGEPYRVRTDRGVVAIPRSQIKAVRPVSRREPGAVPQSR
jgi:hypothetical protein